MARKVFISSDMSVDETLSEIAETEPLAAMMWPWLLTTFDDWGRALSSPKRLKASVFPMFSNVTTEYIALSLELYSSFNLIKLYEVDGKAYMSIDEQKWYKFQTHMNRKNRRPGKDKMDSDHPSPLGDNENPHGESRGLVGSPQFPIPSPSPSLSKDTTTTADVHTKVFGTLMMNGLMQEYVMDLKNKGFTDFFIQELMLETGESGTKPSVRLMKTIGDRWVAEGIYTRLEAKQRKDASKNKRSTNGSSTTGKTGQAAYKKSYEEMSDKFARLRESEDENGIA